jgi:hypothetical protein
VAINTEELPPEAGEYAPYIARLQERIAAEVPTHVFAAPGDGEIGALCSLYVVGSIAQIQEVATLRGPPRRGPGARGGSGGAARGAQRGAGARLHRGGRRGLGEGLVRAARLRAGRAHLELHSYTGLSCSQAAMSWPGMISASGVCSA